MIVRIPDLLSPGEVAQCRKVLEATPWVDGNVTSGEMSARAKLNLQVPEDHPQAQALGGLILQALNRNATFIAAALPSRVFPPLFNRYDEGMTFGAHIDNAVRIAIGGGRIRTDISCTVFLTDLSEYDGGELVIEDTYGEHAVKLPAGHAVVYPAESIHRVAPVTRGARWSSFFWIQSMVRADADRALLWQLDQNIMAVRTALGDDDPAALGLTGVYHNILRRWAEV